MVPILQRNILDWLYWKLLVHPVSIAYETFGEFFARSLKPNSRNIEKINGFVSACDGKVLHCGQLSTIDSDSIYPEQVKGSIYPLNELIGEEAVKKISCKPGKNLFYCTIYLAPGDYHRFHAPANMKIDSIQYFSGELLSVAPWMMKIVPKLLCMNERVAINGRWKHGFISYVPVGAANVGSIVIDSHVKPSGVLEVGKEIGHFELGSTVVLIFEAPSGSSWTISPGDRVELGKPLFKIPSKPWWYIF